jgi:hypothetical protein
MFVNQPKIPYGTVINAISGTSVTLSNNATGTLSGAAVGFSPVKDAQMLDAVGGALSQSTTIVTANLPAYTPSGSVASSSTTVNSYTTPGTNLGFGGTATGAQSGGATPTITSAFTGVAQGGTSAPIIRPTVPPTIVMNYMIKR